MISFEQSIPRLIEFVARGCRPERLTPMDFSGIKNRLVEPVERTTAIRGGVKGNSVDRRSPTTVAGDVCCICAFLSWCFDSELTVTAPRYGKEFSPASQKVVRRQQAQQERRDIPAGDIRAVLDRCSRALGPLVLIGINAGVGNLDITKMTMGLVGDIVADEVWIDLPRSKTGAPGQAVAAAARIWARCPSTLDRLHGHGSSTTAEARIRRWAKLSDDQRDVIY